MQAAGIEPTSETRGKTSFSHQSGAESGEYDALLDQIAPDLAMIFEAWPKLSEAIRAGIVAMIRSALDVHCSTMYNT